MTSSARRRREGAAEMVVYLDTLFLLNALVDYLLLLACARLAGERLRRLRLAAGAAAGGLYAAAIFLPGLEWLAHPLCKAAAAAAMVLIALGGSRRLLRQCVIFLALSCALGGGILAIVLLGGRGLTLRGGVIYSGLDLKIVLLSAAGCYGVMTLALSRVGRHTAPSGEVVPARFTLGGRSVELLALVDTGNTLTDPATGQGVAVAEGACLSPVFPPGEGPTPADLADPAQGLARLGSGAWRGRFRLLPYRAVGVEWGMLLAVRLDSVKVNGKEQGGALVALSPTPVSDGGSYRVLVGRPE